jgi:hypothetical protein
MIKRHKCPSFTNIQSNLSPKALHSKNTNPNLVAAVRAGHARGGARQAGGIARVGGDAIPYDQFVVAFHAVELWIVNLTKIESRPHRHRPIRIVDNANVGTTKHFEYMFYVDFQHPWLNPARRMRLLRSRSSPPSRGCSGATRWT